MGNPKVDEGLVRLAARNNAELCDLVCRSHSRPGTFTARAWTCGRRTSKYYPDAVTFVPALDVAALLAAIDSSSGASVKDSFATLDLSGHGFRVLFDAEWIARAPDSGLDATSALVDPGAEVEWSAVTDSGALVEWERAWSDDGLATGRFRPELLAAPELVILRGECRGELVAGAIVNRTDRVVGISNLFATDRDLAATWTGCLTVVATRFPGFLIVGYESGDALAVARRAGFRAIGPLRIWIKD